MKEKTVTISLRLAKQLRRGGQAWEKELGDAIAEAERVPYPKDGVDWCLRSHTPFQNSYQVAKYAQYAAKKLGDI